MTTTALPSFEEFAATYGRTDVYQDHVNDVAFGKLFASVEGDTAQSIPLLLLVEQYAKQDPRGAAFMLTFAANRKRTAPMNSEEFDTVMAITVAAVYAAKDYNKPAVAGHFMEIMAAFAQPDLSYMHRACQVYNMISGNERPLQSLDKVVNRYGDRLPYLNDFLVGQAMELCVVPTQAYTAACILVNKADPRSPEFAKGVEVLASIEYNRPGDQRLQAAFALSRVQDDEQAQRLTACLENALSRTSAGEYDEISKAAANPAKAKALLDDRYRLIYMYALDRMDRGQDRPNRVAVEYLTTKLAELHFGGDAKVQPELRDLEFTVPYKDRDFGATVAGQIDVSIAMVERGMATGSRLHTHLVRKGLIKPEVK